MDPVGTLVPPPPFIVGSRKEWFTSDEDDESKGFSILVRTDITVGEQARLRSAHDAILEWQREVWKLLDLKDRDPDDTPRTRELALIAPYVFGWNAKGYDIHGELIDILPPHDAGVDAFRFVFEDQKDFCSRVVLNGYLLVGKALALPKALPDTGDPSVPETTPPETQKPNRSRRRKS